MSMNEEEVSVRGRESVGCQKMMTEAVSTESEAQRRRTACAWAQGEPVLEGEGERIQEGVVAQSVEVDGMDSLWRVKNVIEGGQGTREEAKEVRDRVVPPPSRRGGKPETWWQVYIQKMVQGRRMREGAKG